MAVTAAVAAVQGHWRAGEHLCRGLAVAVVGPIHRRGKLGGTVPTTPVLVAAVSVAANGGDTVASIQKHLAAMQATAATRGTQAAFPSVRPACFVAATGAASWAWIDRPAAAGVRQNGESHRHRRQRWPGHHRGRCGLGRRGCGGHRDVGRLWWRRWWAAMSVCPLAAGRSDPADLHRRRRGFVPWRGAGVLRAMSVRPWAAPSPGEPYTGYASIHAPGGDGVSLGGAGGAVTLTGTSVSPGLQRRQQEHQKPWVATPTAPRGRAVLPGPVTITATDPAGEVRVGSIAAFGGDGPSGGAGAMFR